MYDKTHSYFCVLNKSMHTLILKSPSNNNELESFENDFNHLNSAFENEWVTSSDLEFLVTMDSSGNPATWNFSGNSVTSNFNDNWDSSGDSHFSGFEDNIHYSDFENITENDSLYSKNNTLNSLSNNINKSWLFNLLFIFFYIFYLTIFI